MLVESLQWRGKDESGDLWGQGFGHFNLEESYILCLEFESRLVSHIIYLPSALTNGNC